MYTVFMCDTGSPVDPSYFSLIHMFWRAGNLTYRLFYIQIYT